MSRILGVLLVFVLVFGLAFGNDVAPDQELPFAYENGQQGCSFEGDGEKYLAMNPGEYFKVIMEESSLYKAWAALREAAGESTALVHYLRTWPQETSGEPQDIPYLLWRDCGPSSQ